MKSCSALDAERVDTAVLGAILRLFAILPVLHELRHRVVGQVFIEVLVVDLDHGSIYTGSEALDLL